MQCTCNLGSTTVFISLLTIKRKILGRKHSFPYDFPTMFHVIRTRKFSCNPTTKGVRVLYLWTTQELADHNLKVADRRHIGNFQIQNCIIQNLQAITFILRSKRSTQQKNNLVLLSIAVNNAPTNPTRNFLSSPSIRVMMLRCARYVTMGESENVYRILARKSLGEVHLND